MQLTQLREAAEVSKGQRNKRWKTACQKGTCNMLHLKDAINTSIIHFSVAHITTSHRASERESFQTTLKNSGNGIL